MNFQETVEFLFSQLPVYQRDGGDSIKYKLNNIIELCDFLGNPQDSFKSIHVAGTNGKGSSSHMLAAVLQESGYTTGLYTSPHLKSFTERIKVDGQEVEEAYVVDFVERIQPMLKMKPSFFEITVAMSFDYFRYKKVEIAVVEVGLGGRLDSTNIIQPEVCLITNIGLDHKQFLGETLPEIAAEKAGIIKTGVPVVINEKHPETISVFKTIAAERHAPIFFSEEKTVLESPFNEIEPEYLKTNTRGVFSVLSLLKEKGWKLSNTSIKKGIMNFKRITGLKGRWQQLSDNPKTVCDTGHNREAFQLLSQQIKKESYDTLWIIVGMVNDKEPSVLFETLPKNANWIFTEPKIYRKRSAEELLAKAEEYGIYGQAIPEVNKAIAYAHENAQKNDFIFVGGSNFVVAEIAEL